MSCQCFTWNKEHHVSPCSWIAHFRPVSRTHFWHHAVLFLWSLGVNTCVVLGRFCCHLPHKKTGDLVFYHPSERWNIWTALGQLNMQCPIIKMTLKTHFKAQHHYRQLVYRPLFQELVRTSAWNFFPKCYPLSINQAASWLQENQHRMR